VLAKVLLTNVKYPEVSLLTLLE